jgi:hypothetical protein
MSINVIGLLNEIEIYNSFDRLIYKIQAPLN